MYTIIPCCVHYDERGGKKTAMAGVNQHRVNEYRSFGSCFFFSFHSTAMSLFEVSVV